MREKTALEQISKLLDEKNFQAAAEQCKTQLAITPDQSDFKIRLAFANHKLHNYAEAEKVYLELLEQYQEPVLYFNLGCLYTDQHQDEKAKECYLKTLELEPNHRSAHNNVANILRTQHKPQEALEHFEFINKHYVDHVNAINGAGACYAALGQHEKAINLFEKSVQLKPMDYHAHTNYGIELLTLGDFEKGWEEYAWRFQRPDLKRNLEMPEWQGESLEGKRLLIHAEQGAGDTIQFLRFLPHIKTLGAEIVFECHKELYALCYEQTGIDVVIAKGSKLPQCDYHIPLLSLAQIFNTNLDNIPNQVPYLYIPETNTTQWKNFFSAYQQFKVGLVWAGNPAHSNDINRSCQLKDWLPFLALDNIDFFSLQKKFQLEQLQDLPDNIQITNLDDKLQDYIDTAACISQLDLVITVDTSVAHLAGALGKPVWTLIPFVPDWRWMLNTEKTPWYPTMRLFRQQKIGDWQPVIEKIAHILVCRSD